MPNFAWTCPYCGKPTTITDPLFGSGSEPIGTTESRHGLARIHWRAIACPNKDCREITVDVNLFSYRYEQNKMIIEKYFFQNQILPDSTAKPFPEYVPKEIRATYFEACKIATLSPKASATLSRRCLQGMVRDFWKISDKPNLYQELEAIKDLVASDTWDAIDGVRKLGNIGAHMEKNINLIVEVDPQEAAILIQLIESLIEDWYMEREKRRIRNATVKAIVEKKTNG